MDPATKGVLTSGQSPGAWHGCVVLSSELQACELLAEVVADGISARDRVVVLGLRAGQLTELQRRLHEQPGCDPDRAITEGQVLLVDEALSERLFRLRGQELTTVVTDQVDRALLDGYREVRIIWLYPDGKLGAQELVLDRLTRTVPLTVLCAYHATELTADQATSVRRLHARETPDTALLDDGRLRITRPRPGWLRLAGRWDTTNHDTALAVVSRAVATGDRDLDVSSLRFIDPTGVHALLTRAGRVRLRSPNSLVQHLARLLGREHPGGGATDHLGDLV